MQATSKIETSVFQIEEVVVDSGGISGAGAGAVPVVDAVSSRVLTGVGYTYNALDIIFKFYKYRDVKPYVPVLDSFAFSGTIYRSSSPPVPDDSEA